LIEKLLSPEINLSPNSVKNADGSMKQPGLDNHGMGTVFEELVHRFNEENNEEAGEHWTPRDAVKLMANLILLPIADEIESGTCATVTRAKNCSSSAVVSFTSRWTTVQSTAADIDSTRDPYRPAPPRFIESASSALHG
jgi:hypothetical protein